jgi:hypothetical protein
MSTTAQTRKPIDVLTLADLEAFPIWEFATDESDVFPLTFTLRALVAGETATRTGQVV